MWNEYQSAITPAYIFHEPMRRGCFSMMSFVICNSCYIPGVTQYRNSIDIVVLQNNQPVLTRYTLRANLRALSGTASSTRNFQCAWERRQEFVVETRRHEQTNRKTVHHRPSQINRVFIYQFQKKPRLSATLYMTQVPGSIERCRARRVCVTGATIYRALQQARHCERSQASTAK